MGDWDPALYGRYKTERAAPFFDLMEMIEPRSGMDVVDLGCGTGELTAELHWRIGARSTLGIDNSASMLERSDEHCSFSLQFRELSIEQWCRSQRDSTFDLVLSNAALHWVEDHPSLLETITAKLRPGGQLAVQVPSNYDHPSHRALAEVGLSEPFASALGDAAWRPKPVLEPEQYAELLYRLGYERQHVRLQIYGHLLPSSDCVFDWLRSTAIRYYEIHLPDDLISLYLNRVRDQLREDLGIQRPYYYTYKRILMWAQLP